jgi:hypothetical protein
MLGTREPVVLILDPDAVYGADLIDYYFVEHGLRSVLGFTEKNARRIAFADVPQAHSRAVAARMDLSLDPATDAGRLNGFDVRAVPAYQEPFVIYAAHLLELLGVAWNPPEVVARFRDKFALKEYVRSHDPSVRMNASCRVGSVGEVLEQAQSEQYRRFVLKPADGMGNADILLCPEGPDEVTLERHFQRCVPAGRTCVMEEFLDGEEYYVDGQVDGDGVVTPIAIQLYRRGTVGDRSNIALGHRTIRPDEEHFDALFDYARGVIGATGLVRSPFHMEIKVDDRGPCMIECGARLVGWAAGLEDSAAHGRQLDVVRVAGHYWLRSDHIDIPLDFTHYLSRHGVHVIGNTLESGVAAAVHGVGRMEADPAFYRWVRKPRVGRSVEPTISTETILWGVHLVSADKSELDAAAQWALRNIVVDVVPANSPKGRFAKLLNLAHHARRAARSSTRGLLMYR